MAVKYNSKANKKRNKLYKSWKKFSNPALFISYKSLRNDIVTLLRSAKKNYFNNLNIKHPNTFWKTVKQLSQNSRSIPTLNCGNGNYAQSSLEKATALSSFFDQCFTQPLSFSDLDTFGTGLDCPEEFLCSEDEVYHLLVSLDIKIPARVLKLVAPSIAASVTELFGCFPLLWKTSNIVAIPKSGDYRDPCNYRPISLLSVLSKVLERHISLLISDYLMEKNIISDCQWGFTPKRSTTTALLSTIHECIKTWNLDMKYVQSF